MWEVSMQETSQQSAVERNTALPQEHENRENDDRRDRQEIHHHAVPVQGDRQFHETSIHG